MFARCRLAVFLVALILLPLQAMANVLMPLCAPVTAGQEHSASGCDHALASQDGAHGHPEDHHAPGLETCGVCHLTSGTAFGAIAPVDSAMTSEWFYALAPSCLAGHIPEQPHHPPLSYLPG